MRDLVAGFIAGRVDRREFLKAMTAGGFTLAAAESVLATLTPVVNAQAAGSEIQVAEGTGSYLLIQQLKAAGVKHVFYGNGTSSASMLDAMVGDNDINLILGPEEGIVTAMASGYALASNEPTFVNVHGAVGTANQMLNMFNAKRDGDPLVVSSFTKSTEGSGRDNFEEVDDLVDGTKQFTRWSFEVPLPSRVPELLRNAMRISTTPPGGATFLSIPTNVAEATGRAEIYPRELFAVPIRTKPDPRLVEQAAQILIEARKPFMLVGLDAHRDDAYDETLQLAELLGMQVVQGLSPFTDFPTDHPLYVGQSDRAFTPFRSLEGADVLINMGSPMLYQEGAAPVVSPYWKIIEVRSVSNDVARWNADAVPLVANVKETAAALLEAVKSGMSTDAKAKAKQRLDNMAEFNRKVWQTREAMAEERKDQIPIAWEHVAREAQKQLEPDAIITHEFNSAMPRVLPWLTFGRGKKELFGRTLGSGLGWSVGAAIGIKMAKPDRQTVCMVGDGAFLMGQIEALWAARRFEAPVLYVVFNNRSFNDTRMRVSAIAPRLRESKLDMGSYLGSPDVSFETAAKAFDVNGATVTRPGEIAPALARGIKELRDGRPFVIDVVAERVGLLADSTWYPKYSIAERRTKPV
jgi:thiamine pyrophosphate-dependent acetolactate synthase large subunit-like protein